MFVRMNEQRIRQVIKEETQSVIERNLEQAIEKGVYKALAAFGADVYNPAEMQKDFLFIRERRRALEETGSNIKRTFTTVMISGLAVAFWEGLKLMIHLKTGL